MNLLKRFFMPYIQGPGCVIGAGCGAPAFPSATANCLCEVSVGGINELYFLPCTATFSEENLTDLDFWTTQIGTTQSPGPLGRSGLGIGSIAKGNQTTTRVASCRPEQIASITWNLVFQVFCIDKTSARSTHARMDEMLNNFDKYLLVARTCDGDDTIIPIGRFTATDMDFSIPETSDDNQSMSITLSWKEKNYPRSVDVAGLSAILPKLS